jgi:hypothetical protein
MASQRLVAVMVAAMLAMFAAKTLFQAYSAPSGHADTTSEQRAERRAQLLQGQPSGGGGGSSGSVAARADEVHRPLRLDGSTIAALLASLLVSALANSAGVGGGAFFVPLFK